jgi:hypothetical protein
MQWLSLMERRRLKVKKEKRETKWNSAFLRLNSLPDDSSPGLSSEDEIIDSTVLLLSG